MLDQGPKLLYLPRAAASPISAQTASSPHTATTVHFVTVRPSRTAKTLPREIRLINSDFAIGIVPVITRPRTDSSPCVNCGCHAHQTRNSNLNQRHLITLLPSDRIDLDQPAGWQGQHEARIFHRDHRTKALPLACDGLIAFFPANRPRTERPALGKHSSR